MLIDGEFLQVPLDTTIRDCISSFIEATSTSAVSSTPCISCAREMFTNDTVTIGATSIPNQHLLKPNTPHAKQDLLNGMVIYKPALTGDAATICMECLRSLQDGKSPKIFAGKRFMGRGRTT